jgi:phospholipase C
MVHARRIECVARQRHCVVTSAIGKPAACPNISAWRRKVTGDLTGVFDFAHPVYGVPSLPSTAEVTGIGTCAPPPNPAPQINALPAQEPGTRPARAAVQNGWYDFTVTADADATWSRRYTGHIETGAASVSG